MRICSAAWLTIPPACANMRSAGRVTLSDRPSSSLTRRAVGGRRIAAGARFRSRSRWARSPAGPKRQQAVRGLATIARKTAPIAGLRMAILSSSRAWAEPLLGELTQSSGDAPDATVLRQLAFLSVGTTITTRARVRCSMRLFRVQCGCELIDGAADTVGRGRRAAWREGISAATSPPCRHRPRRLSTNGRRCDAYGQR